MSIIPPTPAVLPTPAPAPYSSADTRQMAFAVYVLLLAGLFCPLLPIVGLVLAYIHRETAPDWLKSHHEWQIRTFWIGLLYQVISIVLCMVVIGLLLLLAQFVWYVVRCVQGLDRLSRHEPVTRAESWLFT